MDRENNQRTNGFLMFIFSLLPGAAHMYLGLMKRGVQLLAAFVVLVGIATLNVMSFLLGPILIVLWVYSFFDGYNIYRSLKAGKKVLDESFVEGLEPLQKFMLNGYWVGLVLIVLGGIALLSALGNMQILRQFRYFYYNNISDFIPAVFLLVVGAVLMVKGNKQRKNKKIENVVNDLDE